MAVRTYVVKLQKVKGARRIIVDRFYHEANCLHEHIINTIAGGADVKEDTRLIEKLLSQYDLQLLSKFGRAISYIYKNVLSLIRYDQKKDTHCRKHKINYIYIGEYKKDFNIDYNRNRVHINNLGSFRVLGLHQIRRLGAPSLLYINRKPTGYFLHIQICASKSKITVPVENRINKIIAIDFGLNPKITLSNGIFIDFGIEGAFKELRKPYRRKRSFRDNRRRIRQRLERRREKLRNQLKDIHRKIQHYLSHYRFVVLQDDYIKGWRNLGVDDSFHMLQYLKKRLKDNLTNLRVLGRYEVTTNSCLVCGTKVYVIKKEKKVICPSCGWNLDRNLNAALVMIKKVSNDNIDEILKSTFPITAQERDELYNCLKGIKNIRITEYLEGE